MLSQKILAAIASDKDQKENKEPSSTEIGKVQLTFDEYDEKGLATALAEYDHIDENSLMKLVTGLTNPELMSAVWSIVEEYVEEYVRLALCRDRFKTDPVLQQRLFQVVEKSRTADAIGIKAAVNAITALNIARVPFSGMDLKGIKIPGADLSYANLDNTQLQEADLGKVSFQGAWLRLTNFSNAIMTDVRVGELSYLRYSDEVTSCAYSKDGRWLAAGCADANVYLFNAKTKRKIHILKGHTNNVATVAFAPRDGVLASGSRDNTICLWEVESGRHLKTLEGHSSEVTSVAFAPGGGVLASGSFDETIRLWEVGSDRHLKTLEGHTSYVTTVAFAPGGGVLASGSFDETIRLWEVGSGRHLKTLEGHTNSVYTVAFAPGGKELASGSGDKTIRVWEVGSGRHLKTLEGHKSWVITVAFAPESNVLASGSLDATIRLWNLATGTCSLVISGFDGGVTSIAWKKIGKDSLIATGCTDKAVRVFQIFEDEKDKPRAVLRWSSHQVALTASEASLEGVCGLSETNLALLKQCGAIGEPDKKPLSTTAALQTVLARASQTETKHAATPLTLSAITTPETLPTSHTVSQSELKSAHLGTPSALTDIGTVATRSQHFLHSPPSAAPTSPKSLARTEEKKGATTLAEKAQVVNA